MRVPFVAWILAGFLPLLHADFALAQQTEKKAPSELIVVNSDGKESKLKNWKIITGARKVTLRTELVKPPAKGEKTEPEGPDYLEFREDNSTSFKEGILTLIPISAIRKIDYDDAKKTVAVTLVQADGKDVTLTGTTKYVGINKLAIEGELEVPGLDTATVRVQGGLANSKPVVRGFRFTHAVQPPPKPAGPSLIITATAKEKVEIKANDIKALYKAAGQERVSDKLLFKKQAKVELAKIAKMKSVQVDPKQFSLDFEITMTDGMQFIFTLIKDTFPDDATPANLQGLIGRVPTGYRLFPPHTISELRREE